MNPAATAELRWYVIHGKYLRRITIDREGNVYVICDQSWNTRFPNHQEFIEAQMKEARIYAPPQPGLSGSEGRE